MCIRDSFLPAPKVDSAVIQLHIRKTPPVQVEDEAAFFALIRAAFAERRKTLVNSVSAALPADKASLLQAMEAAGLPPDIRAERLSLEDFARLAGCMQKNKV